MAVATDLHELAPSLRDGGPAWVRFAASGAGRDIAHTEDLLDAWERDLAAAPVDWLILTGDLTNNGELGSHRALAARLARIEARGTRVLVTPGNHDLANPWARAFRGARQEPAETVSAAQFTGIYRDFGYGGAASREPDGLSYRTELAPGLWILMLDTTRNRDNAGAGQPVTSGRLGAGTLGWIRGQAAEAARQGARLVVGQHHSLFDHSPVIARGFTLDNADEVSQLYAQLEIRLVLTGHIHIQDAVSRSVGGQVLTDIATNALSVWPHQWGLLTVDLDAGRVSYRTRPVDVTGWARASGRTDPALTDWEAWSAADFADQARRLVRRGLEGLEGESAVRAADTMALLNLRSFAGREGLNAGDPAVTRGLAPLLEGGGFLAEYAASILEDEGTDDNRLDLRF